jgi:hypothetical protein
MQTNVDKSGSFLRQLAGIWSRCTATAAAQSNDHGMAMQQYCILDSSALVMVERCTS